MPKYTTRKRAAQKRKRKTLSKIISKDKRILKRWAASGTEADYAKLRKYAAKLTDGAPSYILPESMQELQHTNRRRMIESLHNDGGAVQAENPFMDALAYVVHSMPVVGWTTDLMRNTMEGFKGDSLTEQDEDYAKLVSATYLEDRPEIVEHWRRVPQYDTNYCSLWINQDGHAFIAVRGTKLTSGYDLLQDAEIAVTGTVPGQDEVVPEIQRMLHDLSPDVIVDAGAHSLGTTLLLRAFEQEPSLKKRIRQSFIYNPASSPLPNLVGGHNTTEDFINDPSVRYFINLSDAVSAAFLGDGKVANVVYRSGSALEPMKNHSVDSWYPGDFGSLHTKQIALQQNDNDLRHTESAPVAPGDPAGYTVHFGADDWDQQFADFFASSRNAKQSSNSPFPTAPSWRHADTTAPASAAAQYTPAAPSHVDMAAVRQLERRNGN